LPENQYPLKLVGSDLTSNKQKVGKIASIELLNLPQWDLELSGAITTTIPVANFLTEAAAHPASWDDGTGNTYSGVALWRLAGRGDDGGQATFNDTLAALGYDVKIHVSDGYSRSVGSALIARNDNIIVANLMNGQQLPADRYPLRLVGTGLSGGQMVSKIVKIELADLPELRQVYLPIIQRH
jgi:hypothetical protein